MAKTETEDKTPIPTLRTSAKEMPKEGEIREVKSWFVEVQEENEQGEIEARAVVYERARALFEFPQEDICDEFLADLRKKNPDNKFRKVEKSTSHQFGSW